MFNVLPYFEYEFFISQNFSVNGRYTRVPYYRSFIPVYITLEDRVVLDEVFRDISNLEIGFRWYFLKQGKSS